MSASEFDLEDPTSPQQHQHSVKTGVVPTTTTTASPPAAANHPTTTPSASPKGDNRETFGKRAIEDLASQLNKAATTIREFTNNVRPFSVLLYTLTKALHANVHLKIEEKQSRGESKVYYYNIYCPLFFKVFLYIIATCKC